MQIEFERSGGFAGIRLAARIDTGQLDSDQAAALDGLLQAAGFFALPPALLDEDQGADQFQYVITVDDGQQRHTVMVGDRSAPERLLPLLRHLTLLARLQGGG